MCELQLAQPTSAISRETESDNLLTFEPPGAPPPDWGEESRELFSARVEWCRDVPVKLLY